MNPNSQSVKFTASKGGGLLCAQCKEKIFKGEPCLQVCFAVEIWPKTMDSHYENIVNFHLKCIANEYAGPDITFNRVLL